MSEFTVNRARADGRGIYCRRCTQAQNREAARRYKERRKQEKRERKAADKLTHADRVLAVLSSGEELQFGKLRRRANLKTDELTDVLAQIHGRDKQVLSRNGTGPRVYFLNRNPVTPVKSSFSRDDDPSLFSFSNLSGLHPVIGGRR